MCVSNLSEFSDHCSIEFPLNIIMPPTSKKLKGHIASGTFVRAYVRPLRFFDA